MDDERKQREERIKLHDDDFWSVRAGRIVRSWERAWKWQVALNPLLFLRLALDGKLPWGRG